MSNIGIAAHLGPLQNGGALDPSALARVAAIGFEAVVCTLPEPAAAETMAAALRALRISPVALHMAGAQAVPAAYGPADLIHPGGAPPAPPPPGGRAVALPEPARLRAAAAAHCPWIAIDPVALRAAGLDPAAILRAHAGRCPYVLLAPESFDNATVDWPNLFDAGEEAAVEWYVARPPAGAPDPFGWLESAHDFIAKNA